MPTVKQSRQEVRIGGVRITACILTILFGLLWGRTVEAHRVTIFAWVEGNVVHTESKTGGGKAIKGATVTVLDTQGNPLLTGSTDVKGHYSFEAPQKTDLKVVLDAAMGHRAEWTIRAEEFTARADELDHALSTPDQGDSPIANDEKGLPRGNLKDGASAESRPVTITHRQLEDIIERTLDRKLQPIIKHLAESENGTPGITEIIGGIGYIIGLAGLALYVANRKKNGRRS